MNPDDHTLLEQLTSHGPITLHRLPTGWVISCTWLRTSNAARHRTAPAAQLGDAIRDALTATQRDIVARTKHHP